MKTPYHMLDDIQFMEAKMEEPRTMTLADEIERIANDIAADALKHNPAAFEAAALKIMKAAAQLRSMESEYEGALCLIDSHGIDREDLHQFFIANGIWDEDGNPAPPEAPNDANG